MRRVLDRLKAAGKRFGHDESGDSLVEALAALLIAALAAALLATMVMASTQVASSTAEAFANDYDALASLELVSGSHQADVRIDAEGMSLDTSIDVLVYASDDETFSRYESAVPPGGVSP